MLPIVVAPSAQVDDDRDVTIVEGNTRRRMLCKGGRRRLREDSDINQSVPKRKFAKSVYGLKIHTVYQEVMKAEINVACSIIAGGMSKNAAALRMLDSLRTKDVDILKTTCVKHINIALDNDGEAVSPQKRGGCSLPSSIKKKIAATVKELRRRKFHVFHEEVINWAAEEIRGTEYADIYQKGVPGRG